MEERDSADLMTMVLAPSSVVGSATIASTSLTRSPDDSGSLSMSGESSDARLSTTVMGEEEEKEEEDV